MECVASFDIETFCPIERLSQEDLLYLIGRKEHASKEKLYRELSTNPYVSYLISFSLFFIDSNRAEVYYISDKEERKKEEYSIKDRIIKVEYCSVVYHPEISFAERKILEMFWDRLGEVQRLITFYGEDFDMEFIKVRTIIHNLKPQTFLLYLQSKHPQVLDISKFFKVGKNHYSLSFISTKLNIPIDKGEMEGSKVREAFLKGRYRDIAEYNLRDALITGMLYERIKEYI